ncbi:cell division protein PerM [Varibaculum timonense]|uniref:cell division protein PerM n=1 Tax=Varibaculum timonense TaxID=1964383 RepID=UPI0022E4767D|nr:DUF6350 family protein [Varibaculum timonense]
MVRRLNFQKFLRQPAGAGKGSTRTSTIKPKNPKRPLKAEAGEKGVATSQKTRRTFTVRIQPGITRMVAAALITCVFPWIIILACCAGVYFSTSSNPWIVDIVWTDSLAVGSSIWALGFATPLHFTLGKAATMSLIPLGLWIAYLWLGAHLAHRLVLESKTILWVYPFAQALVATLVGLVVRGAYSLGELFFWALLHGFIVVGYAFYLFDREQRPKEVKPALRNFKSRLKYRLDYLNAQSRALRARLVNPDYAYSQDLENRRLGIDRDERSWDGASSTWTVPGWVVSGVRSGWKVFVFFGFITLILVLTQVFSHFSAVDKIYDLYGVSLGAGILIWLAQLLYLPTVQTWALTWVLGPGFAQGTGTVRSLTQVKAGPIPAVPILGALPNQTPGYWVLALIVAGSLVVGYGLYTSMARVDFFSHIASFLVGALSFTVLTAWFCFLASGSIGTGRMSVWGAQPLATAAMGFILVWLPIVLVGVVLHPRARAYLADNFFRARRASLRVSRQGIAAAKEKAKELHSRNPLSAEGAVTDEDAEADTQETGGEDSSAKPQATGDSEAQEVPSAANEVTETEQVAPPSELPMTDSETVPAGEGNDSEAKSGKKTEAVGKDSEDALETTEKSQADQLAKPAAPRQSPEEKFARSRGALPVDTEEIKDLATDWAERKTDEVIAKERQELEKIKSSAQRLPEAELTRPAIKRSIFKRGRLRAGKPRRGADDTSTQAIEIPDQD